MARSILSDAERLAWERFPQDPDPEVGVYFTLADGEVDVPSRPRERAPNATPTTAWKYSWMRGLGQR